MEFFKARIGKKSRVSASRKVAEDRSLQQLRDSRGEGDGDFDNRRDESVNKDTGANAEDEDDDFIFHEVGRRLKELRRKSFMMRIPEEDLSVEEDEVDGEDEVKTCEWRDVEAEGRQWWGGFDAVYDKYCERMLFFDRTSSQHLREAGDETFQMATTPLPSPKRSHKKLPSHFRCLSLKMMEELEGEKEFLHSSPHDPFADLETAYVAQCCLSWEALHCQYSQLHQRISCHGDTRTCYNHSAKQFQQFQVLVERFIENEPFEQGVRPQVYARSRIALPKLLQVPNINGANLKLQESESEFTVKAIDLLRIMENSILTFHNFLKLDRKKHDISFQLLGNQNSKVSPLQMVQSLTDKKNQKLKEQCKKIKGWKRNSWPKTYSAVELLFGLVDLEMLNRLLRMGRVTKEQLVWCEEKLKKIDFSNGILRRDSSPILFPC